MIGDLLGQYVVFKYTWQASILYLVHAVITNLVYDSRCLSCCCRALCIETMHVTCGQHGGITILEHRRQARHLNPLEIKYHTIDKVMSALRASYCPTTKKYEKKDSADRRNRKTLL